jgi:hypothetical protein
MHEQRDHRVGLGREVRLPRPQIARQILAGPPDFSREQAFALQQMRECE